jgi:zinc transport system substrate-binding protein
MWKLPVLLSALLPVLLVTLALLGCGGAKDDGGAVDRTLVVAAFYPLAWAAEQVAGSGAEVVNLTPPGTEPHDVELTPRDAEAIRDADLVVYVGGGFQPAVEDAVDERHGPSLDVRGETAVDPHVWLDGMRFQAVVGRIGSALGRPHAADKLVRKVVELDVSFREGLLHCERRDIVTSHAAFGYLAASYGLRQISLTGSSPESEPTPRELERLIERVRDSGATTVFAEPLVSDRVGETVARETGAEIAVLDPVEGLTEDQLAAGEDYFSVMRRNLATLRRALRCR